MNDIKYICHLYFFTTTLLVFHYHFGELFFENKNIYFCCRYHIHIILYMCNIFSSPHHLLLFSTIIIDLASSRNTLSIIICSTYGETTIIFFFCIQFFVINISRHSSIYTPYQSVCMSLINHF
jgi:hypothetical protein